MRKNIKNYTSTLSLNKSLTKIQKLLANKGAEKIMIDYKDGEPIGIAFAISTPKGTMPIKLPSRFENVAKVMFNKDWEWLSQSRKDQSKRTAWKNLLDWIDAQLALLETEMVKMEEIFLPYVVMGDQTIFEHFESGNLLPSGENL